MPVLTERRGRVLLIRLDRDAKLKAMDHAMTLGLDAAMNLLEDDAELWAGVLSGNGRAFSAGSDLADPDLSLASSHFKQPPEAGGLRDNAPSIGTC